MTRSVKRWLALGLNCLKWCPWNCIPKRRASQRGQCSADTKLEFSLVKLFRGQKRFSFVQTDLLLAREQNVPLSKSFRHSLLISWSQLMAAANSAGLRRTATIDYRVSRIPILCKDCRYSIPSPSSSPYTKRYVDKTLDCIQQDMYVIQHKTHHPCRSSTYQSWTSHLNLNPPLLLHHPNKPQYLPLSKQLSK